MEYFAALERGLWIALLVAQGVLCLRLVSEKLARRYPFFTAYLATEVLSGLALIQIPFHSINYARAFAVYAFLIVILRAGVAFELFSRIFGHFKSGRFPAVLGIAVLSVAGIAALPTSPGQVEWSWPQTLAMLVRQYQGVILGAGFLLLWIVLRYGMKVESFLRPNVLRHWRISTLYFSTSGLNAIAILALGGGAVVHPLNTALLAIDLGCSIAWLRLTAVGEREPKMPGFSDAEIRLIESREQDVFNTVRSLPGAIEAKRY